MENTKFDNAIREIASGPSRRSVLSLAIAALTGTAGAAVFTTVATDEVDAKGRKSRKGRKGRKGGKGGKGNKGNKPTVTTCDSKKDVTFCHKPGTPAEKTMTLNECAYFDEGHEGHGDTLGPCKDKPNFCQTDEGKACECGCDRDAEVCVTCPDPEVCPADVKCYEDSDCKVYPSGESADPGCVCVGADKSKYIHGSCEVPCVPETCESLGYECGEFETCGQKVVCGKDDGSCKTYGDICVEHECVTPCKDADVVCYSDTDCCEGNVCKYNACVAPAA